MIIDNCVIYGMKYLNGVRLAIWMLDPNGNGEKGDDPPGFSLDFCFCCPSSMSVGVLYHLRNYSLH
jgi:hypothetical protein